MLTGFRAICVGRLRASDPAGSINNLDGRCAMLRVTEGLSLEDHEVEERFVRAIGAGGQNARREATAVELRLDIGRSSLPADVQRRLRQMAGRAVTTDDVLVIVGRASRSQADNRVAALARLTALIDRAAKPATKRGTTEPPQPSREERLESKKHRAALKASRSPSREAGG
jgi:ribosome-associated protein